MTSTERIEKEDMAATGIAQPANGDATSSDEKPVNGESPSRKRSRSGSRKPKSQNADDKGIVKIESDLDKFRFLQILQRDSDFQIRHDAQRMKDPASMTDYESYDADNFVASKKAERDFWDAHRKQREEQPGRFFGPGFQGYGNARTQPPQRVLPPHQMVLYAKDKPRLGKRKARSWFIPRADMLEQSLIKEELVPIRLDLEHANIKLRDTFTWNLRDSVTNPDYFAEALVEDFSIPPESAGWMTRQVAGKIREQVVDHYPHMFTSETPLVPGVPYFSYKNDEMRIMIRLNVTIGTHTLVDQFEWDINDPTNDAEEFSRAMARDLALSGEFTTAIAHCIREQVQMFTKSLFIINHPFDGRLVEDADVRDNFLQSPINSVFRPFQSAKDHTPYLYELSEADLQREELSILRDQRRQKRSTTRRGGPALPDLKDRERTIRSLVLSTVLPGAAQTIETARLFKLSRTSDRSKRRVGGVDLDTDESEEEDSDIEQEIMPQPVSTSRGRLVRGAAAVAQQAMRANNYGRSVTPDVAQLPEPRASVRREPEVSRFVQDSESEPDSSLIVTLRLPKQVMRQWAQNPRLRLMQIYNSLRPKPFANGTPSTPTPSWTYSTNGHVDLIGPPKKDSPVSIYHPSPII